MKPLYPICNDRSWLTFAVAVVAILTVTALTLLLQWEETVHLRAERELGRMELDDAERLRTENRRLRTALPAAAELETLRADHAALVRLRSELDALSRPEPPR